MQIQVWIDVKVDEEEETDLVDLELSIRAMLNATDWVVEVENVHADEMRSA